MVGPHAGWAVGAYAIFATADGQNWTKQLASTEQFVGLDFISATTGWVVGVRTLLGTTNGGKTWQTLGEGPKPIRSVHFVSATEGWAIVGGGNPIVNHGVLLPAYAGALAKTDDGGHSWALMDSPADPESVCFSDPSHGWLGTAEGQIYASGDGGHDWAKVFDALQIGTSPASEDLLIQCAAPSALWAEAILPGAAMSHRAFVVYASQDGHAWRTVMAEPYALGNLLPGVPPGPDSYPPSFSVIDPRDAVFVGDGPATMVAQTVVATNGGATLRRTGSIADSTETFGAAFASVSTGWVLTRNAGGDYVIDATSDSGSHWAEQLAVTPSSAG